MTASLQISETSSPPLGNSTFQKFSQSIASHVFTDSGSDSRRYSFD